MVVIEQAKHIVFNHMRAFFIENQFPSRELNYFAGKYRVYALEELLVVIEQASAGDGEEVISEVLKIPVGIVRQVVKNKEALLSYVLALPKASGMHYKPVHYPKYIYFE